MTAFVRNSECNSEDCAWDQMESGNCDEIDFSMATNGKIQSISNCCAICLDRYSVGQTIAWSTTCQHAFHLECIIASLAMRLKKSNRTELPCPICRQPFCYFPRDAAKKESEKSGAEETESSQ